MIKINLLNDLSALAGTKVKKKAFSFNFDFDLKSRLSSQAASIVADETRDLMMRIVILIVPVLLTFSYDRIAKYVVEEDLKKLNAENTAIQTKLKAQEVAVKEVDKFQEEKRRLDSELQIIKALSKERLKNVKAMDALQGIIPQKAWLTALKIVDRKVEISGLAMDEFVISDFMQGLASSIYFSNVVLVNSEEEKKSEGVVKKFQLRTNLENL